MKPFLFLVTRSDDEPANAEYETFLRRTGLGESTFRRLRLEAEFLPWIDLDDRPNVLVGGSPFNVSTLAERKSATQKRIEAELSDLLDRVVMVNFPFLGACYGAGTLACHQGAVVDTIYGEAVTAPDITPTEADLADPICAGVPKISQVFAAHKEVVTTLPPHAVVLGIGEACSVQISRIGPNLCATQSHPELDGSYLTRRSGFYASHGYLANNGLVDLQARVRLSDVSDSWKLLADLVSVHVRD